ncbi:ribbon-helix-helix domain-containing protein [Vibrio mimicus]|uniref:ribbon-helix-helix domain-containing protein n=1 Tax=Vibrio mimicus TaxID=674 RepID=UPI0011D8217B|nr:ribbon-helix-helix domain-containing protein [Vibrio mimicus]TXY08571.1 ribbon-helix-helix domain-containing protein [Vibrio mimicus]
MCEIFANQPKENYQFITRSVRIDGHATSVKLEASFWNILEEIAQAQSMSLPKFIGLIYREALEYTGDITNFASLLRCSCLIYLRDPTDVMTHVRSQLLASRTSTV